LSIDRPARAAMVLEDHARLSGTAGPAMLRPRRDPPRSEFAFLPAANGSKRPGAAPHRGRPDPKTAPAYLPRTQE
jgi:hypothetical protein